MLAFMHPSVVDAHPVFRVWDDLALAEELLAFFPQERQILLLRIVPYGCAVLLHVQSRPVQDAPHVSVDEVGILVADAGARLRVEVELPGGHRVDPADVVAETLPGSSGHHVFQPFLDFALPDLNLGDKLSHRLLAHPDLSHGLLSHIFLSSTEPVAYLGKSPRCPHSGEAFCICY